MRIDRKKLTLIIASLCGMGSSACVMGQDYHLQSSRSSVGRIGDTDGAAQSESMAPSLGPDARPVVFRSNVVDPSQIGRLSDSDYVDSRIPATNVSYVNSMNMGNSCNSCGDHVMNSCRTLGDGTLAWAESETLLWWGRGIQSGPLVVGGNSPTATPTTPLVGGPNNPLGTNLLVGMRLNVGKWLDCDQNFGVGARGWGLFTQGKDTNYTNNGNSTGVPFFNTSIGAPDIYLVNINAGANGANSGTITVKNDLNLIAGEVYGRALLARDGNSRADLIGGYTFVRLDNELGIGTSYIDGVTNTIQNGTRISTRDEFQTKNEFHGGHIGLMNEINRGRFSFNILGKVALGNMKSTSAISGSYTEVAPNNATVREARGLFAQSSNSGMISRNQFTFLPEANAKIKYTIGRAQFGVGYTMMLFPSVAVASNQLDRNIDIGNIGGTMLAPVPKFNTETFFLHGLDLGVTYKF